MSTLDLILVAAAVVLLGGLLAAERANKKTLALVVKTTLSCLFVVAAVVQPHPVEAYFHWVLAGLVLGLVGDVCLALPGDRAFQAGLVAFLLGHVAYIVAFAGLVRGLADFASPVHVVVFGASAAAFWWFRPHLGEMLLPVVAYVVVITVMVAVAWSGSRNPLVPDLGGITLLLGTVAFYISDLCVAREKFIGGGFANKLVGLPLYYAGQFLIAFSVGLVG